MRKRARLGVWMLVMVSSVFLTSSVALAKAGGGSKPAGFAKGEKKGWKGAEAPPGWKKGKKKGWKEKEMPPGLAKKAEGAATETT